MDAVPVFTMTTFTAWAKTTSHDSVKAYGDRVVVVTGSVVVGRAVVVVDFGTGAVVVDVVGAAVEVVVGAVGVVGALECRAVVPAQPTNAAAATMPSAARTRRDIGRTLGDAVVRHALRTTRSSRYRRAELT
jgi:hypothetical protein